MPSTKPTTLLTSESNAPLRADLRAVVSRCKLPPSSALDIGLVQNDLETWDRLSAAFLKTSAEELRKMAKETPSAPPSRGLAILKNVTKPLTQEQAAAIVMLRHGPPRGNASADDHLL